jgi:hypothetical protein
MVSPLGSSFLFHQAPLQGNETDQNEKSTFCIAKREIDLYIVRWEFAPRYLFTTHNRSPTLHEEETYVRHGTTATV